MERELPLVCRMAFQVEASKMELYEPMFAIMILMTLGGNWHSLYSKKGGIWFKG
jgi:hypothetical protein